MISYSHKDNASLERLHTHLAVLRRDGQIEEWYDRDILAGDEINAEITEKLETCGLFLLIVSPDFLASDYCVNREMTRALERHRSGDARVIPIIVEPCDWKSTPLRDLKVLPQDGKPVSEWTNENNAYLDVVQELRRVLEDEVVRHTIQDENATTHDSTIPAGVRRYRVKRDFDEIDRSDFREEAFGIIRDYFNGAVEEIDALEDLRARFYDLSPTAFRCTIVNRVREHGTTHITVHGGKENVGLGDITYSFMENAPLNSANGMYDIKDDEYELYLSPTMDIGSNQLKMTPQDAAKRLWERLLEQAGISSD